MEDETWWLVQDYNVKCWEGDHAFYWLVLALPGVVLWGFGLPILFLFVVVRLHPLRTVKSLKGISKYFYTGYRTKHYHWELLILVKKLILISIGSLLAHYSVLVRGIAGFFTLAVFLCL